MNRRTAILTAALAGLCAASQPAPTVGPKQVAELAKRTPGKPQRCVTVEPGLLFQVSESDPQLLLYDDGKTIWASVLAPGCGFQAGQSVVPDESASYYCRGDFVRAGGRQTLIPGRRCALGDFTPYRNANDQPPLPQRRK